MTQDKMNAAYKGLTLPGYAGYSRLYVREAVAGRKSNDNKYSDVTHEWDRSIVSNVQSTPTTTNATTRTHSAPSQSPSESVPVSRLWRSIYTSSCANSTLSDMSQSSRSHKQNEPDLRNLPLSYNLLRPSNAMTGYERDIGRDPRCGPLTRTVGEPSILQMSSTNPLFSATAKSDLDQRFIAGYSGHIPGHLVDKQTAASNSATRARAWFYDVSTTNM